MPDAAALLEAVRTLRAAQPGLGVKPLVARLRAEQPGLGAEARLVREALGALERDKAGLLQNAAACRSKAQAIEVGERRPSPLSTPPNARCCQPSLTPKRRSCRSLARITCRVL